MKGAVYLVKEYYPFGTGFGTYGSASAAENYSQLYYLFGFNNYYGMKATETLFLHDNFWPMVFGQLGIFGGLVYSILIFYIFFKIFRSSILAKNNWVKTVLIATVVCLLITTIQSSSIVHYSIVPIIISTKLALNLDRNGDY